MQNGTNTVMISVNLRGFVMGGLGSGRWPSDYVRRKTAESCLLQLCVSRMYRNGLLQLNEQRSYTVDWVDRRTKQACFRIDLRIDLRKIQRPSCQLTYRIPNTQEQVAFTVNLRVTRPYYGGSRVWFACPICSQRVGKLYLPLGANVAAVVGVTNSHTRA